MNAQELSHYEQIARAIEYIKANFKAQPDLNTIAEQANMSPFHFQRLFKEWAGVSPKKFIQYLSLEHAKGLLRQQVNLLDTAYETGLSGPSRLHDLFIQIEGMTPGEYKNGGESLQINYSFAQTPFGEVIVASTPKGICYMHFAGNSDTALNDLQKLFPNARYQHMADQHQQQALNLFTQDWSQLQKVKLHLKGTAFQLKVWEALLKIPMGSLVTYAGICSHIENHKAARAVGSAIGSNPVAFLIPCHRVIRGTGSMGGYLWGLTRKTAIIGWESALVLGDEDIAVVADVAKP
ncbi:methylated-DNA--[protein]-cysteine S-methyltransferase [Mucilaginibacter sp. Bleaf8]|uniref:bifunctional transcriptional activator/DNA repair enzyme AdaA n=1 Tax=Mucilaginibacter sp. Bleaf8 TaxID=2834430 RepID=UPI001BCC0C13|nr:methylated-DNA--[protein]-cysteine S-methyltransferase [Mucilaginibacter sp. Bleaf8]MBS7565959.1 methylated-DNA--[protein]-cysteine S-methyltransferase [Mucilaginibacter sp. Bleaf8]